VDKPQAVLASEHKIQKDDIGLQGFPAHESVAAAQGSDYGNVRLLFEHRTQAFAEKAVVFDDDQPDAFHLPLNYQNSRWLSIPPHEGLVPFPSFWAIVALISVV
jgi:hypothetical protein